MSILSITNTFTGFVDLNPNFVFINTSDSVATVQTAGYLNAEVQQGNLAITETGGLASTIALVMTTSGPIWMGTSVTGISPNLVYSLVAQSQASGSFSGTVTAGTGFVATTGGLTAAAGNIAASTGNLIAGSSGHAGTISAFPGTAANGTLILSPVNAGGAFNTTISNGVMGQSSVYTIPDVGAATGNFIVSPSGNNRMKALNQVAVAGGAAAQTVNDAFCTATSTVVATWNDTTNAVSIQKVVAGAGSFVVTSSGDPGASHINYIIVK